MIDVMSEPTGKEYEKLMAYALRKSDALSMVFCNYYNLEEYENRTRSIRASMERFLLKTRSDSQWPGTISYDTRHKYTIDVYRTDQSLLGFLYTPGRLFGWLYPHHAEDIAFFRKGTCWFSTCAHEHIALIHSQTKEDIDILQALHIKYSIHPDMDPYFEVYE